MSCSDDDEVVTLQYWLSNSSTELSLNIATYYTTFDEGGSPFPSWPLAVPVAVIVLGLLLFLKKN